MAVAGGSAFVVECPCPLASGYAAKSIQVECVTIFLAAGMAQGNLAGVSAFSRHRHDTDDLLHVLGGLEAFTVAAERRQETGTKLLAGAGQGVEQMGIRVFLKKFVDVLSHLLYRFLDGFQLADGCEGGVSLHVDRGWVFRP